jgi:hypothetical protein
MGADQRPRRLSAESHYSVISSHFAIALVVKIVVFAVLPRTTKIYKMGSVVSSPPTGLKTLLVSGIPLTTAHRARLEPFFSTIRHFPDRKSVTEHDLAEVDTIYGTLPSIVKRLDQVDTLRFLQLASAGSDVELSNPIWKETDAAGRIKMATAAGVHTGTLSESPFTNHINLNIWNHPGPIPQYFIMTVLALFHRLQAQILIGQVCPSFSYVYLVD